MDATFLHASTRGMGIRSQVFDLDERGFGRHNSEAFDAFTFAPRIFAGVQTCDWGVLGRFWYLSDSSGSLSPFATTTGVATYDRIKAYTADFEITRATVGNVDAQLLGFMVGTGFNW